MCTDADVRGALGKKKRHAPSVPLPRLTTMQRTYFGRLVAKYGDNFEAMARDTKLNRLQQPSGALKLLYRRFEAYKEKPVKV